MDEEYANFVAEKIKPEKISVVADFGNGAACLLVPKILKKIGVQEIVSKHKKCYYTNYFTVTLCFLGAGAIVFLGMQTSSNPSLNVDSAFSGITSSGNDSCL